MTHSTLRNPLEHTHPQFNNFYHNNIINTLADNKRWTVSDDNARPINITQLTTLGTISGASYAKADEQLMTLPDLITALPNAANRTYWAQYDLDHVLVLDIEKTCPPDIKHALLKLPHYYSEVSKSGRGVHMIIPPPDDPKVRERLDDSYRKVLRTPNGDVEILLQHWVTFTRNPVEAAFFNKVCMDAATATPDERLQHCTSINSFISYLLDVNSTTQISRVEISGGAHDILTQAQVKPQYDQLVTHLKAQHPRTTLEDSHGDMSAYEFTMAVELLGMAFRYTYDNGIHKQYTREDYIACIFESITEHIPARSKHNELRAGMPYLMYSISGIHALNNFPTTNH